MALPDFLIVRPDDLVVLGVSWTGCLVETGSPASLVVERGGRVAVVFPPQALGEEKFTAGEIGNTPIGGMPRPRAARLAGTSRIEFQPPTDRRISLTATGLLEALFDPDSVIVPASADLASGTMLELPWRLVSTLMSTSPIVAQGQADPVRSDRGVAGLFRARLRGAASAMNAGLSLLPLRAVAPGEEVAGFAPLASANRESIVARSASTGQLPSVARLELSALGGTLRAGISSPGFAWSHDLVMGRDMEVRVVTTGVLYPFGHRAQVVESATRGFSPLPLSFFDLMAPGLDISGAPKDAIVVLPPDEADPPGPSGNAVAALEGRWTLTILEPVVGAASDPRLARQLPFGAVEIAADHFELQSVDWSLQPQRKLSEVLDALQARRDEVNATVQEFILSLPDSFEAYLSSVGGTIDLDAAIDALTAELADLRAAVAAQPDPPVDPPRGPPEPIDEPPIGSSRPVDTTPITPPATPVPSWIGERIVAAEGELAAAQAARAARLQQLDLDFRALPRDVAALAERDDPAAMEVMDLDLRIARIRDEFPQHQAFFTPRGLSGEGIKFPIRARGRLGEVAFSVPMVFVSDTDIPASEGFEAFTPLTDPDVQRDVRAAWGEGGRVPMAGLRMDLVQAATPSANDVQEVHELVLSAAPQPGGFKAVLDEVLVELPTLRSLLPNQVEKVAVGYAREYLDKGADALVALAPKLPVEINFEDFADRSGGLVAPKFAADVISRELGLVAVEAVSGAADDLAAILSQTKLLGMDLGRLVAGVLDDLPGTPKITPIMKNSLPSGVEMTWKLRLRSHAIFVAGVNGQLELKVRRAAEEALTRCTVSDFALSIPAASPLVRLTFGALRFEQKDGRSPDVAIEQLRLDFGGALQLVRPMLAEVQKLIGSGGPRIVPSGSGVAAHYTMTLPNISSGVFVLRNIAVHVGVDIPFKREPVTVSLGFARRENPFNLSVLMFGGGGYIDFTIGPTGLTGLEAAMEFGASVEMNFVVARGEVHALGGVRFALASGSVALSAFIRIGGSVDVLGLVSVSVELVVTLQYVDRAGSNRLVGRATLVIEIDVTLFSESVELDTGEWVLAGDEAPPRALPDSMTFALDQVTAPPPDQRQKDSMRAHWRNYRSAFA